MKSKAKVKVLVKIFVIDNGDEGEIIRQFVVKGKNDSVRRLAINLQERIEEVWVVQDVEAWTDI